MADLGWLFNVNVLIFLGKGLGLTIAISVVSEIIAFLLGALLALGRLSPLSITRYPSIAYIETLRSLPLLLLIFFVFFALNPTFQLNMTAVTAGIATLAAFNGAVVAEILRAGIQSVDRGIVQAAQSQALSPRQIFLMIELPLALRRMTPALVTQFISLLKSTSLLVVIGVEEFLSKAVIVTSNPPFDPLPVYALVAVTYFVANYSLSLVAARLERLESGGSRSFH